MKSVIIEYGPGYNRDVDMAGAGFDPLYWDDAYPIALVLKMAHPEADPVRIDPAVLREWVIALPGFADEPGLVCTDQLIDIQAEWVEIGGLAAQRWPGA